MKGNPDCMKRKRRNKSKKAVSLFESRLHTSTLQVPFWTRRTRSRAGMISFRSSVEARTLQETIFIGQDPINGPRVELSLDFVHIFLSQVLHPNVVPDEAILESFRSALLDSAQPFTSRTFTSRGVVSEWLVGVNEIIGSRVGRVCTLVNDVVGIDIDLECQILFIC
jgi:hypothetical protein